MLWSNLARKWSWKTDIKILHFHTKSHLCWNKDQIKQGPTKTYQTVIAWEKPIEQWWAAVEVFLLIFWGDIYSAPLHPISGSKAAGAATLILMLWGGVFLCALHNPKIIEDSWNCWLFRAASLICSDLQSPNFQPTRLWIMLAGSWFLECLEVTSGRSFGFNWYCLVILVFKLKLIQFLQLNNTK